MELKLINKS